MLNQVFLKTYSTHFDEIIVTFTDQNGRLLGIADKINLTLTLNIVELCNTTIFYRNKNKNMLKDMDIYHLRENIKNNYWIQG